jgi:hypothetical protein
MGTSLGDLSPGSTYPGLIKFGDNGAISTSIKAISDGEGNDTPVGISSSYFNIGGSGGFNFDNSSKYTSLGGTLTSPGFGQRLRVIGQGNATVGIYRNQASSFSGKIEFMKSRGTYDFPTSVNTGDEIGSIAFFSHNGTSYGNSARIYVRAGSTGGTLIPGILRFVTFASSGGNLETMEISNSQVKIGADSSVWSADGTLTVRGIGTTGANSLVVKNASNQESFKVTDSRLVIMPGLPTSSAGLPSGALWNDDGTLKIV